MLVNAALELAPYDPEFQKVVSQEMVFIETFLPAMRRGWAERRHDLAGTRPAAELAKASFERSASAFAFSRVLARSVRCWRVPQAVHWNC